MRRQAFLEAQRLRPFGRAVVWPCLNRGRGWQG
jgi:hypothetical protein